MATWIVGGSVSVGVTFEVEAESEEDAFDKAYVHFDGLMDLAGNGRSHGALIGTCNERVTLSADDSSAEFDVAHEKE